MLRNLVLLLTSGHTVRIALRDDDLANRDDRSVRAVREFLRGLPAVYVLPAIDSTAELIMAYIENPMLPQFREGSSDLMPDDHQRITVEGPGTVVQY